MSKQKISLLNRITHLFTYHPWLKLVALLLAILAWLYVRAEIGWYSY